MSIRMSVVSFYGIVNGMTPAISQSVHCIRSTAWAAHPARDAGARRRDDSGPYAFQEGRCADRYTEDEQHGSVLVMIEEHLRCSVRALVVGEDVMVVGFDRDPPGEIMAR